MQNIHFLVSNTLNQQIKEAMSRLGINSKAEFFRMLILNCAKENKVTPIARLVQQPSDLTPNEKIILSKLETGSKTIDDFVMEMGLSVPEIANLLVQLLLKNLVVEEMSNWRLK